MELSWLHLVIFLLTGLVSCEYIIQTFDGEIGAGNFTYFTLKKEGDITLILESLEGDADIYVSQNNPKPDYDNYDLKSATCGDDIVTIPSYYKRPIAISVFGHVYAPLSKYTMKVLMDYSTEDSEGASYENEESQESLIWTLFVNILKIILEILLWPQSMLVCMILQRYISWCEFTYYSQEILIRVQKEHMWCNQSINNKELLSKKIFLQTPTKVSINGSN